MSTDRYFRPTSSHRFLLRIAVFEPRSDSSARRAAS